MDVKEFLSLRTSFNAVRRQMPSSSRIIFEEYSIMCLLKQEKVLSATQIAEKQRISCPTMTHRSSHLCLLGYLANTVNAKDRRRLDCQLTRKGTNAVAKLTEKILQASKEKGLHLDYTSEEIEKIATRAGRVPTSADQCILLTYLTQSPDIQTIMQIVQKTSLLQPTVSMAVLRLKSESLIEHVIDANGSALGYRMTEKAIQKRRGSPRLSKKSKHFEVVLGMALCNTYS